MATIFYDNEAALDGPWLFRRDHLLALDKLFDDYQRALAEDSMQQVERLLVIKGKGNAKVSATSFQEAERELRDRGDLALTDFLYTLKLPETDIVCSVVLDSVAVESTTKTQLIINVERLDAVDSRAMFKELLRWSDSASLPSYERYFERYGGWAVLPAIIMFFIGLPSQTQPENYYKREARHMLSSDGGYHDADAVRLLLQITSDADAPANAPVVRPPDQSQPLWFWLIDGWLFVGVLFLYFSPTRRVGLGPNERVVKRWAVVRQLLAVTIPGVIFLWLGEPYLKHLVGIR